MSAVASASSAEVQALLFPKAYGTAASELRLMVWGFSGYSFAVTTAWVFNSIKRSKMALVLVTAPLLLVVVLTNVLVPQMFTFGAAVAVAVAGGVAVLVSLWALHHQLGAAVPLPHVLKVAAAVAAVELVARLWPALSTAGIVGKVFILAKLGVLAAVFAGVVAATRAVTLREVRELRSAR
jgi:stage V sporulation protein B